MRFSEPILAGSFSASDIVVGVPGGGTVAASAVTLITDTRFTIKFPAQTAFGAYMVQIGPNITDLAGNVDSGLFGHVWLVDKTTVSDVFVVPVTLWRVCPGWRERYRLSPEGSWTDSSYRQNDVGYRRYASDVGAAYGGLAQGGMYHQRKK